MTERSMGIRARNLLRARLIDPRTARNSGIESTVPVIVPALQAHPALDVGTTIPESGVEFGRVLSEEEGRELYITENKFGFRAICEALGSLGYIKTERSFLGAHQDIMIAERLRILSLEASCTEADDVHIGSKNDTESLKEGVIVVARRRLTKGGLNTGLVPICDTAVHDRDPLDAKFSFYKDKDGRFQFYTPTV